MAKPTKTLIGADARKAVIDGVNAVYEPVKKTLGPEGKTALLFRTFNRGSRITDDGVTVADCQDPKNPHIRLAANAFKEMCKRTVEKVGDGTTTTAVIGGKGMNDVFHLLSGKSNFTNKSGAASVGVVTLRKQILATAEKVKQKIKEKAVEIDSLEKLEKVATISVKDEKLGRLVAGVAHSVGVDGFIDVVEGYKGSIEIEEITGFRFPAKVAHRAFVNNPARFEMVMADCHVLVTNYELDNAAQIGKVFQSLNANTSKVIVVAPAFSDNVLQNMVAAFKEGYFIYPVKAPSLRTDQFEDLAVTCGAKFIDKNRNKSFGAIKFDDLGFVEKMVVKDTEAREDAVITGGRGTLQSLVNASSGETISPVQERIEVLKKQLEETKEENFKNLLRRRIASMASSVAIIRVGDSTQASALYLKLKIEDAVYACKAALRGGYVKGGGLCLKDIVEELDLPDSDVLKSALLEPYQLIQGSVEGGIEITDDIIDPAEAVYYAVDHAASIIASLATVEIITCEIDDVAMGEGEMAISRSIIEMALAMKQHYGLVREGELEAERDSMKGLTVDEMVQLDNG